MLAQPPAENLTLHTVSASVVRRGCQSPEQRPQAGFGFAWQLGCDQPLSRIRSADESIVHRQHVWSVHIAFRRFAGASPLLTVCFCKGATPRPDGRRIRSYAARQRKAATGQPPNRRRPRFLLGVNRGESFFLVPEHVLEQHSRDGEAYRLQGEMLSRTPARASCRPPRAAFCRLTASRGLRSLVARVAGGGASSAV